MGVACVSLPWGGKEEGSWGESVALAQTQSQAPTGPFWETFGLFYMNFQVYVDLGCLAEANDALGLKCWKKLWICGSVLGETGFQIQTLSSIQPSISIIFWKRGGRVEVMTWRPWKLEVYWDLQVDLKSVSTRTSGSAYLVMIFV